MREYYQKLQESYLDFYLQKRKHLKVLLPLLNLVSLILYGETIIENALANAETVVTNLAQLLRFNAVKTKQRCDGSLMHSSKFNEPLRPLKIGLLVHPKTRKKSLVETDGLSISYQRVQDIQKMVTNQLCDKFKKDCIVCSPSLHQRVVLKCSN